MKAQTLVKMIKSANTHSGKKDVRYYLNGVYFNVAGDSLKIVGTDGHRLIELSHKLGNTFCFHGEFILENATVKMLLPVLSAGFDVNFKALKAGFITFEVNGIDYKFQTVDGRYPDYKRVFNAHNDTCAVLTDEYGLNIDYLADIQKACKVFKRKFNVVKLSIKDAATSIKWEACFGDGVDLVGAQGLIMPAKL